MSVIDELGVVAIVTHDDTAETCCASCCTKMLVKI